MNLLYTCVFCFSTINCGHLLIPPMSILYCHFRFIVGFDSLVFQKCSSLESLRINLIRSDFTDLNNDVNLPPLVSNEFKRSTRI